MLNKAKARDVAQKLISFTNNYAIVRISDNSEKLTRFANSEIHQNVEIDDTVVTLTVCAGNKLATGTANVFDDESLEKLAANTDSMLLHAPDSEYSIVRVKPQDIPETYNDERLAENFDIKGRVGVVKHCVEGLQKDYSASGVISLDTNMQAYGSSDGAFYHSYFDSVSFSAVITNKDGSTGYGGLQTNNLDNCNIDMAIQTAYDKAKAAINPIFADLGAYTVVLEPAAVANLLRFMLMGLNGARYQKGLSFASDKIGERLFSEHFTVRDDVTNPVTFQRFFDAEGNRRQPVTLIENGVLKNVLYCSKTASKTGATPTGHAIGIGGDGGLPQNVIMEGGDSSLPEMIKGLRKGILVTHFHYCNAVNAKTLQITGLTRDGTFLIEDGKITTPLRNMRFTESLLNAFSNIKTLSKDLTSVPVFNGPALVPAAVIEDFHFTSGQK